MKKLINTSFTYAILAMIGGVFYREFTKFNGFAGKTSLAFLHLHLFAMGMIFFLVVTLLNKQFHLEQEKRFNLFYWIYNAGMAVTVVGFTWRGVLQTLLIEPSKALTASISGISGLGHITLGVGIILFFIILKKQALKPAKN